MQPTRLSKLGTLMVAIIFSGCASYAPSLVRLDPSGPNARRAAVGELNLYVEEYATPEKSEKAFDTNMAEEGVLPVLILVVNTGQQSYDVKAADITVRSGETLLTPLALEDAASRAKRNPVGRALGWSLVVPIVGIPAAVAASAIHTNTVNKELAQDFAKKAFVEGTIAPNRELSGFLFYEVVDGTTNLAALTLEMAVRNSTTGEVIRLEVPLPEVTIEAKARHIPEEEQR